MLLLYLYLVQTLVIAEPEAVFLNLAVTVCQSSQQRAFIPISPSNTWFNQSTYLTLVLKVRKYVVHIDGL